MCISQKSSRLGHLAARLHGAVLHEGSMDLDEMQSTLGFVDLHGRNVKALEGPR